MHLTHIQAIIKRWLLIGLVLWLFCASLMAYTTVPQTIANSLMQSQLPTKQAAQVAAIIRSYVPLTARTTMLYLDGRDGGDNYYRVRYLLYPLAFVDYWSWQHPNAGGYVWNAPRFATISGLRKILLSHHVQYLITVNHPQALWPLHISGQYNYLFKISATALHRSGSLRAALRLVVRW